MNQLKHYLKDATMVFYLDEEFEDISQIEQIVEMCDQMQTANRRCIQSRSVRNMSNRFAMKIHRFILRRGTEKEKN